MITVTSNIVEEKGALVREIGTVDSFLHTAITTELNAFIDRLRGINPVRSGRMKAGYGLQHAPGGSYDVMNDMSYAEWVAYSGTKRMRPNTALHAMIDAEGHELELAVEGALTAQFKG